MKKYFQLLICLFTIILLVTSCKSLPEKNDDSLYIMIYDYENNAIKGVSVFENDKEIGTTDIYGRFVLIKHYETPKISFSKKGYESISIQIEDDKNQVLYVKLGSGFYYFRLSEKSLDAGDFTSALNYIDKALQCEERSDYEYLKNIIIKKRNENEKK